MRRRKIDSGTEKQLLAAMITSKSFLSQAFPFLQTDLISAPHFREVSQWCVDYYNEYGEAPGTHIEGIYNTWAEGREDETVDAVQDLLEEIDYEPRDLNIPYLLDNLGEYLSKKKLKRLLDQLEMSLSKGDREQAEAAVLKYRSIEVGRGVGVDPLNDRAAWKRSFSTPNQPLIHFPGDAGRFFNNAFTRDSLIGIQAPEKRGKTFWCIEFMIRALRERRKVAVFQVGDLSEGQFMLRLGVRLTGRPLRKKDCGPIQIPTRIKKPDKRRQENDAGNAPPPKAKLNHKTKECDRPITYQACLRAVRHFMRGCGIPEKDPYLMTSFHANSSITIRGVEGILDRWESERGFIPDVIIIDYADILLPEDPSKQSRDQHNDTWKAMRRLSQERHSLVISPTQADAGAYSRETQTMKNFSEDKRKYAHVTGMLGLNQTEVEKESGVMRVNWLVLRESPFNIGHCLWVGQCLTLGRAFCCGTL